VYQLLQFVSTYLASVQIYVHNTVTKLNFMINKRGKYGPKTHTSTIIPHSEIMGMNRGALFLRVYSAPHKINSVAIPMSQ